MNTHTDQRKGHTKSADRSQTETPSDNYMTVKEVAQHLRSTDKFVRDLIHRGELGACRLSNHFLIAESDVAALLVSSRVNPGVTDYSTFTLPRT
jgi:excisionase family DNA binding protein